MATLSDFDKPDGSTDWDAYRKAEVADGTRCYTCGSFIVFENGHSSECADCKSFTTDRGEVSHASRIRCPKCGHVWDAFGGDHYSLYEDGEHDVDCEICEHSFEVSTTISYSLESPERLPDEDAA